MGAWTEIHFVLLGLATGVAVAWLLMLGRTRQIVKNDEARCEAIKKALEELLSAKEQQTVELKAELKGALAENEKLLGTLRDETEKRAMAEEKNTRLPELQASLHSGTEAYRQLAVENTHLKTKLSELETRLMEDRKHAEEKLALLREAKDQLKMEFQNIANKIFEDKSRKFTSQNQENLDGILAPVREQLTEFKRKIEDVYDKESKERVSLFNEIANLKTLNQRISEDAVNLTNALRGQSKTQGAWGEIILERLLEESGLQKGREYETQAGCRDEKGRQRRPDVIIHLPDEKDVIVDSKVSLTAYERYCSAKDDKERERELERHILSLRMHIKCLSERNYEALPGVRSLDFVLLFLPVEGAFMAAIENGGGLFNEALERNIILVSPSTLLATLRTIQNIWRYEYQNRNAQVIAKKAGNLHDKFVGFIEALEDIGHKIGKAREAYDAAHNRLTSGRGNLIRRAQELENLGVKTQKSMPAPLAEQVAVK